MYAKPLIHHDCLNFYLSEHYLSYVIFRPRKTKEVAFRLISQKYTVDGLCIRNVYILHNTILILIITHRMTCSCILVTDASLESGH